ncbi:MAG: hypothetical protein CVU67_02335 [Deltaproteobacteria bacterium HGW-Deltaproteobacteria-24]|jgi:hypothetical protein|nr:MAG: hypothetical protein CVU67_02335 [Deltaproteobacteria bacterium HGW-Deltaproteobacteria-24]
MKTKNSNLLLLGFLVGFFIIGFIAFQNAMPQDKNERVYSILKPYLPYTVEKRLGGFTIVDKKTDEKTKPPASEALKYMDSLDKQWGKEFLKLQGNVLIILDANQQPLKQFEITSEEKKWVEKFFEI